MASSCDVILKAINGPKPCWRRAFTKKKLHKKWGYRRRNSWSEWLLEANGLYKRKITRVGFLMVILVKSNTLALGTPSLFSFSYFHFRKHPLVFRKLHNMLLILALLVRKLDIILLKKKKEKKVDIMTKEKFVKDLKTMENLSS